jgi:hypothetical protein
MDDRAAAVKGMGTSGFDSTKITLCRTHPRPGFSSSLSARSIPSGTDPLKITFCTLIAFGFRQDSFFFPEAITAIFRFLLYHDPQAAQGCL